MLQQLRKNADPEFGRIYMDSQLFEADIVTACREHGLNWMIQAPDKEMYTELAENASSGEPKKEDITFTNFDASHRTFNAIIWPVPDEEVGQKETTPATDLTRYHDQTESINDSSSDETDPDSSPQSRLDRHGKMPPVAETPDAGSGESDTHTIWITDMDVGERDLEGLGYQYRHRWRIETAIRQLKHTFQGQCRSSDRLRRAVYYRIMVLGTSKYILETRTNPSDVY
ncbi:hypothetical protein DJ82_00030 [Halorubrum sp. Ib24]|nr:hypothetical protein DJ82_00030 [Halorubrum sp. Ib24]